MHTGFGICELRPDGTVDAHVHSYEESFHLLSGTVALDVPDGSYLLELGNGSVNAVNLNVDGGWLLR